MTTVALNSLVLAGGPADYAASTPGWVFTGLGDWDATSESKSDITERPLGSNGAFGVTQDWRKSLAFSVHGVYLGENRASVQAAKRALKTQVSRGRPVTVVVTDADGPRRRVASCRAVTPDQDNGGNEFGFAIDLVAFDPAMYGPTQIVTAGLPVSGGGLVFPLGSGTGYWDFGADGTSGRASVTNGGSADTWPIITATGGLTGGFTATDISGSVPRTVRFSRDIPVGSTVTIDQRTQRAWIDDPSNDVSGYITSSDSDFFSIGPGETHLIQFAPNGATSGTPGFTLSTAPAYL